MTEYALVVLVVLVCEVVLDFFEELLRETSLGVIACLVYFPGTPLRLDLFSD